MTSDKWFHPLYCQKRKQIILGEDKSSRVARFCGSYNSIQIKRPIISFLEWKWKMWLN